MKESQIKNKGKKGIPFAKSGKIASKSSWRTKFPKIDHKKCIKCHLCWLHCPDGAIKIDKNGFTKPDPKVCKGCSVCATICPVNAIKMEKEKR